MAQASSIAREPSMEEILASIRKIIEDSDAVQQTVVTTEYRGTVAPFKRPEEPESADIVTYSSARPYAANQQKEPKQDTQIEPEIHNAPVSAAQITVAEEIAETVEAGFKIFNDDQVNLNDISSDFIAEINEPELVVQQELNEAVAEEALIDAITQLIEEPVSVVLPATANTDDELASVGITDQPSHEPLVSAEAEQRVVASFNNLAEALRAEQIRQLEEQAEALLQPLLKDWLDVNLAPMVERLVQEEIQRIIGTHKF